MRLLSRELEMSKGHQACCWYSAINVLLNFRDGLKGMKSDYFERLKYGCSFAPSAKMSRGIHFAVSKLISPHW